MTQSDIFTETEGDCYYSRNKSNQHPKLQTSFIQKYIHKNYNILDIGCSDGYVINALSKGKKCNFYGIDPSKIAINCGKRKYPNLNLTVGTADKLPYKTAFFDIVYFGFSMYLIDRTLLLKSIYCADRVLKNEGFLIIRDFASKTPVFNKYKHDTRIHSYKMNYSTIFTSLPNYTLLERHNENIKYHISIDVLQKNNNNAYMKEL